MNNSVTKTSLDKKRAAVVDAFLLFRYRRLDSARKRQYEQETRAERIARTMRLEGDQVTAQDVQGFLKH